MDFLQAIFLGLVQGLTEWLPVSSSGHLVIAQNLMGLEVPVAFDIALHAGTLLAVFVFFRKDILMLLKSLRKPSLKNPDFRLLFYVILGTIPTAIIGLAFLEFFESLFLSTKAVGLGLLITGVLLLLSRYGKSGRTLDGKRSLLVGIFQGFSIAPDISRSGATISGGLLSGVKREEVFRFSFILSIPAILGASLLEVGDISSSEMGILALAGAAVAAVSAYFARRIVQKALLSHRFHLFAAYCFALGAIVLLFV